MLYEEAFGAPKNSKEMIKLCSELAEKTGPVKLMEICGTHTMAIGKSGIRGILPPQIELLSGPGCPVCVTPPGVIEQIGELADLPDVMITCYGDLLRIPGETPGETLLKKRAQGKAVESVYSPMDALNLAEKNPQKEIIFIGIGFETTAPGTAAVITEAARRKVTNFSVLSLLKQTPPALRALIEAPDFAVNGFLCPGHVTAITGTAAFEFLTDEYALPGVVSGFEAGDILYSVCELMKMLANKRPEIKNEYTRLVKSDGNRAALEMIGRVFEPSDSQWRGLGLLADSGYSIRSEYKDWDASVKFSLSPRTGREPAGCHCTSIIRGVEKPQQCPLFGRACMPDHPVGPCMVSGEGSCAAAYRYQR